MVSNVWECKCGRLEYGKYPPNECPKCWTTDSFVEVPEDMVDELESSLLEDLKKSSGMNEDEGDEYEI